MSLALKFTSLAIRTFSKPIANYIKRQAREHPGFRTVCVSFAQSLHRVDMRWRIGLLQDSAALERQAARDAAKKEAERKKAQTPTAKTEAEAKAEEAQLNSEKLADEKDKHPSKPKIKPLSETKAIESGANFISETFLFSVAASLILFESWRSGRKEKNRRDRVAEQLSDLEEENKAAREALVELERELLRLRAGEKGVAHPDGKTVKILPPEVYELLKEDRLETVPEQPKGWLSGMTSVFSKDDSSNKPQTETVVDRTSPGPAEKLLQQADKALEEKRKKRDSDEAEQTTTTTNQSKKS